MAVQLPSGKDVGERQFSGTRKVISPDISHVGKGMQAAGQAVSQLADVVEAEGDRRTDFQVAEAEANFLIDKQKEDRAYDHDKEYDTIADRWDTNLNTSLNTHAETIRDKNKRANFVRRNKVKIEGARDRILDTAFNRERDINLGKMENLHSQLRDIIVTNPDEAPEAIELGKSLISSLQEKDMINAQQGEMFQRKFGDETIIESISASDPFKAQELLGQKFVKDNLAAIDYQKLAKNTEDRLIEHNAISWVDDNYSGDVAGSRIGVESIEDPRLRKATSAALDAKISREKRDFAQEQQDIYREWGIPILAGEKSVADIPTSVRDKMTPGMYGNLINAAKSAAQPPAYTPVNLKLALYKHKNMADKTGNWKPLMSFYESNSASMSRGDQSTWAKITVDGMNPEIKSPLTFQQKVVSKFGKLGDKEKQRMLNAYDDWSIDMQEGGKTINDKAVDDWMTSYSAEAAYDTGWFPGSKSAIELKDEDAEIRDSAIKQLNIQGKDATDPELIGDTHQAIKKINQSFSETRKGVHRYMLAHDVPFNEENAEMYIDAYNKAYQQVRQTLADEGQEANQDIINAAIQIQLKEQGL